MRLLRQLGRRKLRTTLTIIGITVGIWALVLFSSMANKINGLVSGASAAYEGKVAVTDAANSTIGLGLSPMRITVADEVGVVDGVAAAVPEVQMIYDPSAASSFGVADQLQGRVSATDARPGETALVAGEGRLLSAADEGSMAAVFGRTLADKKGAHVGQKIDIRGFSFDVVGILEPTDTVPDYVAYVPLSAAQHVFASTLPVPIRSAIPEQELVSQVMAYPADGVDADALADRIEAGVADVSTVTQADYDKQLGSSVALINSILVGVALISVIVGGMSVINTMAMSVAERTREIGIKRAIGGSRGRIVRELVVESGVMGLTGGVVGVALGVLVVQAMNSSGQATGNILFSFSPLIGVFAVAFATVLGMIAGLVPAWGAARLDPVQALRHE
jgi:putative ABC transport system permease protein